MGYVTKNKLALVVLVVLLATYASFLLHEVTLVTADLGRHLQNGQQLLAGNTEVLTTNFYSYTQPDAPFINHHWLGGVIFYALWSIVGFTGLHLFFVLVSLATFGIMFWFSYRRYGLGVTSAVSLLVLPLVAERAEVRPEMFSYIFAALFFILLARHQLDPPRQRSKVTARKMLLVLPLIMVFWVNTHIYFVFGIALIGAFLVGAALHRKWTQTKTLAGVLGLSALATLINPFGWRGALALFYTLQDYGYQLIENMPIWFLEGRIANPNLTTFKVVFGMLLVSFLLVALQQYKKLHWAYVLVGLGISVMGWLALRNLTLFGLFAVPLLSYALTTLYPEIKNYTISHKTALVAGVLALFVLLGGFAPLFPSRTPLGIGVASADDAAARFIQDNTLAGPMFNNYDSGSYLIWHLFPDWRVFTDNRPESYLAGFFKDRYIPMQQDEERWARELAKENFNTIAFYWRDATPWAQEFLVRRVQDDAWVPVFVDDRMLVLVRNTPDNQDVIQKYRIPRERFSISQQE